MFLRFEPIAPYANLSLALIVLLVKPHLLPLVTTWDDLFPGMDWTQPEYFLRRPDQDHAYASVYLVLYGVFGVCAQYCSIAMGEKTGITYSAYTGQQSNRGMPGAATAHKLIFGLYHLTLAALELVVFSTAAETITGTVAERASSARYTAAKVGAAALGALWLAMATLPMHEYQQGPQDVPRHGQLCVHVRHLHGLGAGAAGCHLHGHPRQRRRLHVLASALHSAAVRLGSLVPLPPRPCREAAAASRLEGARPPLKPKAKSDRRGWGGRLVVCGRGARRPGRGVPAGVATVASGVSARAPRARCHWGDQTKSRGDYATSRKHVYVARFFSPRARAVWPRQIDYNKLWVEIK